MQLPLAPGSCMCPCALLLPFAADMRGVVCRQDTVSGVQQWQRRRRAAQPAVAAAGAAAPVERRRLTVKW